MTQKTILNDAHRALGAKMVDFGGWDMPLNYGSQIEEHHQVRRDAGMFDVSHMTVVDLHGAKVRDFLRRLVANSVDKLTNPRQALYTRMPDDQAGAIHALNLSHLPHHWLRPLLTPPTPPPPPPSPHPPAPPPPTHPTAPPPPAHPPP